MCICARFAVCMWVHNASYQMRCYSIIAHTSIHGSQHVLANGRDCTCYTHACIIATRVFATYVQILWISITLHTWLKCTQIPFILYAWNSCLLLHTCYALDCLVRIYIPHTPHLHTQCVYIHIIYINTLLLYMMSYTIVYNIVTSVRVYNNCVAVSW